MPSLPLSPRTVSYATLFSILDLATYADLFLQGVLCTQFVHYLSVNERDSISTKLFVAGLAFLTILKSAHVLAINWFQDGSLFQSLEALMNLWEANWLSQVTIIFGAVITFYVQMFFCHRLWALSHNVYIIVIAITLFIVALVAAIVATRFYSNVPLSAVWYATYLGCAMSGDLLQTGSIVFYLLRHSQNAIAVGPTASMLSSLLRVTIQSAAPGAICALVNFIGTLIETTSDPTELSVATVISAVASIMLPKLYAVAAMWTLNTREAIRLAAVNGPTAQSHEFETTTLGAGLEWGTGPEERQTSEVHSTQTLTEGDNGHKNLQ